MAAVREMLFADAHVDTVLEISKGNGRLAVPSPGLRVDLPRLQGSGVRLLFLACFVRPEYTGPAATARALDLLDVLYEEVRSCHPHMQLVTDRRSLDAAIADRKIAVLAGLEGGEPLAGSLRILGNFYRMGVRFLGLTWNFRNCLADGVEESVTGGGLTVFGREVVRKMESLGMVMDLAHISEAGFWDAVGMAGNPVLVSHSNARRLWDHPRNLTDDQIKAVAATGGVVGVTFVPQFLTGDQARLDDVLDHVTYIASLVGPDHVGFGSDFDGSASTPQGLEDVSRVPLLAEGLLSKGFHPEEVQAIAGGNLLRIVRQILPEYEKGKSDPT